MLGINHGVVTDVVSCCAQCHAQSVILRDEWDKAEQLVPQSQLNVCRRPAR
jgi:hypothetical protein